MDPDQRSGRARPRVWGGCSRPTLVVYWDTEAEAVKTERGFLEEARRDAEPTGTFLADLIATPSLSRRENAVVQRIGEEMASLGYDEVVVDGLGSVIGRIGDGPVHIVFDSHIDTVDVGDPASW